MASADSRETPAGFGKCLPPTYNIRMGLRIVIADDEEGALHALELACEQLGHTVSGTAATGPELVSLVLGADAPIDLAITDAKMPQDTGVGALEKIWRQRPIAAILASADPVFQDHRIACGYQPEFILKPFGADLGPRIARAYSAWQGFLVHASDITGHVKQKEEGVPIRRAKDALVARLGVTDSEAGAMLHRLAGGRPLVEAAREVLTSEKVQRAIYDG